MVDRPRRERGYDFAGVSGRTAGKRHPGRGVTPGPGCETMALLAELAPLHAGPAEELAVLLLRHPLAALLDDGAHTWRPFLSGRGPGVGHWSCGGGAAGRTQRERVHGRAMTGGLLYRGFSGRERPPGSGPRCHPA